MNEYQLRPEPDLVALGLRLAAHGLYDRHESNLSMMLPSALRRLADRMEDCLLSAQDLVGRAPHDTDLHKRIDALRVRAAAMQFKEPSR
jgi:hypothetical protein